MMVENYKEDYRFVVFNSSDDEYQNMEKVKIQYSPGNLSAMTKALRDNASPIKVTFKSRVKRKIKNTIKSALRAIGGGAESK